MEYNASMRARTDVVRLLRIAAGLWLAYLGLSAAIDYTLKSPGPVERFFYIADGGIAVFCLLVTFWPWIQGRLGKAFLPLMIALICALPIIANQIVVQYLFSGPLPPPEAMLSRVVTFLLIALLLTAWQYKWQHVLAFCVAIALVNVGILLAFVRDDREAISAGLFGTLTQAITFLVVGLFISVMVGWLRDRSRALQEANSKLTHYAQTLEDLATSRERGRIAQELHDTLSHTLSGLSVQLETMKAYWDVDPPTARERLDKSLATIRSGLEDTRRVLMALRAKPLEDPGLVPAIRQMAEEAAARAGIALDLVTDELPTLSPGVEQCLFRVAQEAITNGLKHAKAKTLTVRLESKGDKVTLTIRDDGVGFDVGASSGREHFGLLGMRERVELVNGDLSITSQPGHGTTVRLTI